MASNPAIFDAELEKRKEAVMEVRERLAALLEQGSSSMARRDTVKSLETVTDELMEWLLERVHDLDGRCTTLQNCLAVRREETEKRERHVERCEGALRDRENTIHDLDRQVNELRELMIDEVRRSLERQFPGRQDLPF